MAPRSIDPASPAREPVLPGVARGDPAAIRACIERYERLLVSMARRLVPNEVEDAVQEAFVDLWRSAARFDPALGSEPVFVAMVARRRFIDRRRRARARHDDAAVELPALQDFSAASPDRGAEASIALEALRRLRPEQQRVLVLSLYQGLSHDEIAAQTGMPLGTVKAHARRGLARIRAALLGVEEEEETS
jgi:RNA polymerase sigma-70 factor (ECF subfamily)